jgi:uncharacterized protein
MGMNSRFVFSLREFEEGVSHLTVTADPRELDFPEKNPVCLSPVEVALEIAKINDRFQVRGSACVGMRLACVRCLEWVAVEIRADISVLVQRPVQREQSEEEVPEGIMYHDGETMDLTSEIREGILLEIPGNPLCCPDCKGLCPRCGQNLNEKKCACPEDLPAGSAWSALESLRESDR